MVEFYSDGFPKMSTVLPDGISFGNVKIIHLTPSESDAMISSFRAASHGGRGAVYAGQTITQVFNSGLLWMSDTPDERRDHYRVYRVARGQVLIGGLGLGLIALACALKQEVSHVTVIEINSDVIGLVEPYLRAALIAQDVDPDKLEIINEDIHIWKPTSSVKYDLIWLDIWANLCTDNLEDYSTLKRKFARRLAEGGYREWCEDLLRRAKRRGR